MDDLSLAFQLWNAGQGLPQPEKFTQLGYVTNQKLPSLKTQCKFLYLATELSFIPHIHQLVEHVKACLGKVLPGFREESQSVVSKACCEEFQTPHQHLLAHLLKQCL